MAESYIQIIRTANSPSGKTATWDVRTKGIGIGDHLGAIRWFGRWRCYAFYPASGSLYEQKCLQEIADFCANATQEHRYRRPVEKETDR